MEAEALGVVNGGLGMGMPFGGGTLGVGRPLHMDCWIFRDLSRSGRHFQWRTNPPFLHSFSKYLSSTSNEPALF